MNVPAICNNCGRIFPSGIFVDGGVILNMQGNMAGPCPECGSMGHIPDGRYKLINNIIEILEAPEHSIGELRLLANIFQKLKKEEISIDKARNEIEDTIPNLSQISNLLPKTRDEKREDIKFLITTIISIIALLISIKGNNSETTINIENVFNNIYQMEEQDITTLNFSNKKIGRNEPCPCGSGEKYKKCHGDWRKEINESVTISNELD